MEVVLIILFNHKFDDNLEKLREIYSSRFKNVYFIVPFYTGKDADVIAVYGNSYHFQGYLAQALPRIRQDRFAHYLVIADDLLLNPDINEGNYARHFKLKPRSGFIPEVFLLHDDKAPRQLLKPEKQWHWNESAIAFKTAQDGIQAEQELPSVNEAKAILLQHGYDFEPVLGWEMLRHYYPILGSEATRRIPAYLSAIIACATFNRQLRSVGKRTLVYPMVASYSDIVIIPQQGLDKFCHYSGVLAALNLFVEIAIPTALLFAVDEVVQEKELEKKGQTLWSPEPIISMERRLERNIARLLADFPEEQLYIHPVKLSRWH